MPSFSFNIASKPKSKHINNVKIIEHNIIGIVGIDITGKYYVIYNNIKYPILESNFNTKNKEIVYSRIPDEFGKRFAIYRSLHEQTESYNNLYLPFAPGVCVKGNIINFQYSKVFDIKHTFIDLNNSIAKNEFIFWKTNYNDIQCHLI